MRSPIRTMKAVIKNCTTEIELENVKAWVGVYADKLEMADQKEIYGMIKLKENLLQGNKHFKENPPSLNN